MNPEQFQQWLQTWQGLWNLPDLATKTRIALSPRLKTTLGRCYPADGRIRLNPRLLEEPPAILREVLCHEAAHVAVHLIHGARVKPHGAEWKRLMYAAGYEPRARMDPRRLSKEFLAAGRPKTLYLHRCPVCGAERKARRRYRWRCRACWDVGLEGRLEITAS